MSDIENEKECFCEEWALEKGDRLYKMTSWDHGIGFEDVEPIKYCPICGKELPDKYVFKRKR